MSLSPAVILFLCFPPRQSWARPCGFENPKAGNESPLEIRRTNAILICPEQNSARSVWSAASPRRFSFLGQLIKRLHAVTARELNRLDQTEGRAVWYNFWDTRLAYQHSYLALRASSSLRRVYVSLQQITQPPARRYEGGHDNWRSRNPRTGNRRRTPVYV